MWFAGMFNFVIYGWNDAVHWQIYLKNVKIVVSFSLSYTINTEEDLDI